MNKQPSLLRFILVRSVLFLVVVAAAFCAGIIVGFAFSFGQATDPILDTALLIFLFGTPLVTAIFYIKNTYQTYKSRFKS